MIAIAAEMSLMILTLAMALSVWRLLRGPDVVDRILALDTLYINTVAVLVTYGVFLGSDHLQEAAMVIALLGFISTVALARVLLRGRLID